MSRRVGSIFVWKLRASSVNLLAMLMATVATAAHSAQPPQSPAAPAPTTAAVTARAQSPFDLTGYWVAIVTQNWRFRMIVPGRGEYSDVPINGIGKQFADSWDAAADEAAGKQCEAYGAATVMRIPERLHISWANDDVLSVQTDAGMQTRTLHFVRAPQQESTPADPSWQGYSAAEWTGRPAARPTGGGAARLTGSLQITTDHLLPGLLRKNGVPYGAQTKVTEYWDVNSDGTDRWLTVTTIVDDPQYLRYSYITNSIFRSEPDGSKWAPSPCTLRE
jgi:hypothetical protein